MRIIRVLGGIVTIMLVVGGCGNELSASSTCRDFSTASLEEQSETVSVLSSEFETPEYTTPLGEPEVSFYCAGNPNVTLEEFFKGATATPTGEGTEETEPMEGESEEQELEEASKVNESLEGIPEKSLVLGRPSAPVELVMFADLQCPICAEFMEEVLEQVIRTQISEGTARLAFRNFAFISEESTTAGAAAIAAGQQGRGWNFIELFFRRQGVEGDGYVTDEFLTHIAELAGIPDIQRWDEERESPDLISEVRETSREARRLGAIGAPYFAIERSATNGLEEVDATSAAEFEQAIKE